MTLPTEPLLQIGAATDTGLVRDHNEDAYLAEGYTFIVADGMGGHAAGEVAAAITVDAFRGLAGRDDVTVDELRECISSVNASIVQAGVDDPAAEGLGTTVTGAVLSRAGAEVHWLILNVGDSRTYLRSGGQLERRTVDHSEVEEMVRAGYLSAADARVHPRRNVVTRSLGSDPAPQPDVWTVPAVAGDRLLVCSDGLTNELDDAELDELLSLDASAQDIADALVERARIAGGHDNITVVVVQLG